MANPEQLNLQEVSHNPEALHARTMAAVSSAKKERDAISDEFNKVGEQYGMKPVEFGKTALIKEVAKPVVGHEAQLTLVHDQAPEQGKVEQVPEAPEQIRPAA